ncbi:unnamed protein product [Vitrella brassicaformis CCMP3155]|uniref:Uncharacterized protein n=1 Tax=Vitrella brassicaformis (strain CCMP3155) TaxID=1169540 RepID=A0A0G4F7J2_VITBC|nr:unnamed protein product [Vitrella brassicaformis CCMP3155]|eukprot:CEM08072.1 unnamed protein product [Vitrella brassicaformis CCMP3155]
MSAKLVTGQGPSARTIVFDDKAKAELGTGGTALVLKGILPREDGSGGDAVAFKMDADDDESKEDSAGCGEVVEEEGDNGSEVGSSSSSSSGSSSEEMSESEGRGRGGRGSRRPPVRPEKEQQQPLRAFQGREVPARPPFAKLYAAEVDPQKPATYTNTRGDAIPALSIAMPISLSRRDEFVEFDELSDLTDTVMQFDDAEREKGNIGPQPKQALQQSDSVAGTLLLDLANTLTPETPSPSLPALDVRQQHPRRPGAVQVGACQGGQLRRSGQGGLELQPHTDEWEWWTRLGDGLWEVRAANQDFSMSCWAIYSDAVELGKAAWASMTSIFAA